MLVTVGGTISSGKTTLAKGIAVKFKFKHISAGEIMRQLAKEHGMDIIAFSKHAEKNVDVDHEIDEKQKELVSKYRDKGYGIIVDGRLSAYFLNPDIRIWLYAPLDIQIKRIVGREGYGTKEAVKKITLREESERKRYKEIYDIDLDDLSIYDIVLNTEKWDIEGMIEVVAKAVEKFKGW